MYSTARSDGIVLYQLYCLLIVLLIDKVSGSLPMYYCMVVSWSEVNACQWLCYTRVMDPISTISGSVGGWYWASSLLDSRIDLNIDRQDSHSVVPPSVSLTHTNDVLGTLLEERKCVKERMVLVNDGVARIKKKLFVLLTLRVKNESEKLS